MKKVTVDLENCYGIKKLRHTFDFSQSNVYAIYAPNGSMKSSLAQTFKDVAEGVVSKDRIFPARTCLRKIVDEHGADLTKESILVVPPYDEVFGHTEKTSTLLVNPTLRKEYEQLYRAIDQSKTMLLKALKEQSGSKKSPEDLEKEISSTFTKSDDELYIALGRIKNELLNQKDAPFADIPYDTIFDEKVLSFLNTKDFKTAIEEYVKKYNQLLAASTYFKKGTFEYYNAAAIAKNLADNGFFDANHTVSLNSAKSLQITSQKQLEDYIAKEKEGIAKDKTLRMKFADIEKLLIKNVTVKAFQAYLVNNEAVLSKLANIDKFKEEIWKSYLKSKLDLYKDLLSKYEAAEKRKDEIEEEASRERTRWERVIEIFNERFFVPFKLEAVNRTSVILGDEKMLSLSFTFEDGPDTASVDRALLLQALSQGEKKALYILNIIFEVEVRRQTHQETLFIVDDIADSFDYKNKYAIIQYLSEMSQEPTFKQIILTHNFDFFRTVNSRFVRYSHCLMVSKTSTGLQLEKAAGIKNVFVNDWKNDFFTDNRKKIACIPFMRNLIEYQHGDQDPDYLKLTALLHWKTDSATITQKDLDKIYKRLFGGTSTSPNPNKPVLDIIHDEAKTCLTAHVGINFAHKIVLSVAIRLDAERFMATKIADPGFLASITENQTQRLLTKFMALFSSEIETIKTLQNVVLMTPENIHLNSFMYEPILDMSDEHLRKLYAKVLSL